ncbi:hypothetical protein D3C72_1950560 [compost metagenome]
MKDSPAKITRPIRSELRPSINFLIVSFAASRRFKGRMSSINILSETSRAMTISIPSTFLRILVFIVCGRASATIAKIIPTTFRIVGKCNKRVRNDGLMSLKIATELNCKVGVFFFLRIKTKATAMAKGIKSKKAQRE